MKAGGKGKSSKPTMAQQADRHALYEEAVQDPAGEYTFVSETFRQLRGRPALAIREDFCGTANMSCEWVRRGKDHTAIGVDIDPEVLAWGREHNVAKLKPKARMRITLLQEDVRTVRTPPVDAVLAMNFSWQLFKTRESLRGYLGKVHDDLVDDGILFMDMFGGYEAIQVIREKRKCKGFRYVWEQASYNPVDGEMQCYIHFEFRDGSKMKRAFAYNWRLWTLPELRELLVEAGFRNVTIYWEGVDEETGEGNGEYAPVTVGEPDAGWICFIVAEK